MPTSPLGSVCAVWKPHAPPACHRRCGPASGAPRRRSPRVSPATTGRSSRQSARGPCPARRTFRSDDTAVGMSLASPPIMRARLVLHHLRPPFAGSNEPKSIAFPRLDHPGERGLVRDRLRGFWSGSCRCRSRSCRSDGWGSNATPKPYQRSVTPGFNAIPAALVAPGADPPQFAKFEADVLPKAPIAYSQPHPQTQRLRLRGPSGDAQTRISIRWTTHTYADA